MKIDDKYKWLARDENGQLCAFVKEPKKNKTHPLSGLWNNVGSSDFARIKETDERFSFIRWQDEYGVRVSDIGNVIAIDSNDVISKPSHYIGINGLEVEQILAEFLPRFTDGYEAHRVGSAIEYLLRSPLKNKSQDIEKAGQNIEQIKRYNQGKQA